MSKKRFTAHTDGLRCPKHYFIKYDEEIVFQLNSDEIPQGLPTLNKICDLLNALSEQYDDVCKQIKQLEQENQRLRKGMLDLMYRFEDYISIERYEEHYNLNYSEYREWLMSAEGHLTI